MSPRRPSVGVHRRRPTTAGAYDKRPATSGPMPTLAKSLRRKGTLVFVALPAVNSVRIPIFETVLNGITIVGSIVGTPKDLDEVYELHARGRTHVIRETRSIDSVNQSIQDVLDGTVSARIVFDLRDEAVENALERQLAAAVR
jgi:alcohol dehydrogenase, propanol-preferring